MDGTELRREVARLRAGWRAEARLGLLRRGQLEAAAATAADCVAGAREPQRRFDALRRRPVHVPMRWAVRPTTRGRLAVGG